jgi:2-polyprenyl-3-methyl-5-hydroxy-6-metoxy-1,4-benzoquinol methylase
VAKEMVNGTREPFDYQLCNACGTLYLVNPPADIGRYYSSYFSTNWLADSAPAQRNFKDWLKLHVKNRLCRAAMNHPGKLASKILDRLISLPPFYGFQALHRLNLSGDAAILDVGCGNGMIVEALDRIGFSHIYGCDPFIKHEKTFRNGARLLKTELRDMPGARDLIMLHHCFEHVPDPAATAQLIAERLKPRGRCLLRFPNVDSVEFTRYGENWWGLHAPRHYYLLFTKRPETGVQGNRYAHRTGLVRFTARPLLL